MTLLYTIILLRYVPSMPTFWRFLSEMDVELYQKLSMHLLRFIISFLFFNLVMWYIMLICRYGKTLHLCDDSTWSWCMISLMYHWSWFAHILLRVFASMFISDIGLYFSFFVWYLSVFGKISGWWWPHRISLEVFLPLQFLGVV